MIQAYKGYMIHEDGDRLFVVYRPDHRGGHDILHPAVIVETFEEAKAHIDRETS